jgi:hypothetical protein
MALHGAEKHLLLKLAGPPPTDIFVAAGRAPIRVSGPETSEALNCVFHGEACSKTKTLRNLMCWDFVSAKCRSKPMYTLCQ